MYEQRAHTQTFAFRVHTCACARPRRTVDQHLFDWNIGKDLFVCAACREYDVRTEKLGQIHYFLDLYVLLNFNYMFVSFAFLLHLFPLIAAISAPPSIVAKRTHNTRAALLNNKIVTVK